MKTMWIDGKIVAEFESVEKAIRNMLK